tara:strand:- start:100 stop:429 length:330 start_codon:yes stop_codon:yes gene_type:complete
MNNYICEICSYESKIKSNYSRHLKSNRHITNLERHEKSIKLNKIINCDFICNYCGKTFASNQSLHRHIEKCKIDNNQYYKELKDKLKGVNKSEILNKKIQELSNKLNIK